MAVGAIFPLSFKDAQTSNHYLRAIKQFSRWLSRDRRTLLTEI